MLPVGVLHASAVKGCKGELPWRWAGGVEIRGGEGDWGGGFTVPDKLYRVEWARGH